jgi:hypothetical protein
MRAYDFDCQGASRSMHGLAVVRGSKNEEARFMCGHMRLALL